MADHRENITTLHRHYRHGGNLTHKYIADDYEALFTAAKEALLYVIAVQNSDIRNKLVAALSPHPKDKP